MAYEEEDTCLRKAEVCSSERAKLSCKSDT
jgi:hypothetical protein